MPPPPPSSVQGPSVHYGSMQGGSPQPYEVSYKTAGVQPFSSTAYPGTNVVARPPQIQQTADQQVVSHIGAPYMAQFQKNEMVHQTRPGSGLMRYEVAKGEEGLRAQHHIQAPILTTEKLTEQQQFIAPTTINTALPHQTTLISTQMLNPVAMKMSDMNPPAGAGQSSTGQTVQTVQHPTSGDHIAVEQIAENNLAADFTPIKVGDTVPPAHIDLHEVCVNLQEYFEDRSGILFGLQGAFHPVDTKRVVPSILKCMDSFGRLVDFVGCLVVNDPFVVKAWAKKLGVTDQFTFVADSDGKFTKTLGMSVDVADEGLGLRCRRFAAVVGPRAKIRWVGFDDDALAENVLTQLPKYVRTPWKSFIIGIGYTKSLKRNDENKEDNEDLAALASKSMGLANDPAVLALIDRVKSQMEWSQTNPVLTAIESIRAQLYSQGFCKDVDWQLILSDQMPNVFKPTRENILSGLRWLVDGAQAGDSLCFYFAGCGTLVNADNEGNESLTILPMDYTTVGGITEKELYDILAPNVPEACRLTIILDVVGTEAVSCPLPFVYDLGKNAADWTRPSEFPASEEKKLKGEILVISFEGIWDKGSEVPLGSLSQLLTEGSPALAAAVSAAAAAAAQEAEQAASGNTGSDKSGGKKEEIRIPDVPNPPICYREKLRVMNKRLQEWGVGPERQIVYRSSVPVHPDEEFTLADVLKNRNI